MLHSGYPDLEIFNVLISNYASNAIDADKTFLFFSDLFQFSPKQITN